MKLRLYPLKLYFFSLPIMLMVSLSVLLNLFSWFWLKFQLPVSEADLFLHYNVLFGVDLIGESWRVFLVPFVGFVIILNNFFMGWLLFKKDKFMSQVLNFVALVCQIFIVMATFILVFLNI